ncbi:hypothetical protein LZ32DRAFT_600429 [Colletotrichum eremochloae]|nr:hypothetical protein LZ32DRAFT_600429 [Colletotrichum eremochloae]
MPAVQALAHGPAAHVVWGHVGRRPPVRSVFAGAALEQSRGEGLCVASLAVRRLAVKARQGTVGAFWNIVKSASRALCTLWNGVRPRGGDGYMFTENGNTHPKTTMRSVFRPLA